MVDEPTLTPTHRRAAEPPPSADLEAPAGARAAGESPWRSPLRFPPRLEISPLTIRRRPADRGDQALPVH